MELNIGSTIKKLRIARGITQEELAKNMNVTYQAVSKWENNTTTPDITILPKLAIYFGISMDTLFSLDEEAYLERIGNMILDEYLIAHDQFVWAEEYLKKLLNEDETHSKARVLLVELYGHRENRDQLSAIRLCKQGLEIDPNQKTLYQKLTALGKKRDDADMLITFYQSLYQKYPHNDLISEQLAALYANKEKYEDALRFIQMHPTTANRLLQGDILCSLGNQAQAFELWQQIAKEFQADNAVLFSVAEQFERRGQDEFAERYYQESYQNTVSPKPLDALYALAFMYARTRRYQDAINMWNQIIVGLKQEYHITKGESIDWAKREIDRLNDLLKNG